MKLDRLTNLTMQQASVLRADGWTVEQIATTTISKLTPYTGIGRITAAKLISEAQALMNEAKAVEAAQLQDEYYYQKWSPKRIVEKWADEGLSIQVIALTSARALAALKGIEEARAIEYISAAQDILNKEKLYESRVTLVAEPVETNPAFPVAWLSGAVEPPPMSVRVKRIFDVAKAAYEVLNG